MKTSLAAIIAALLLFASSQAHALTSTYYLDRNNSGLTGGPWATVTLEDAIFNGFDAVKFTVDPIAEAFTEGPNFGLQNFYFNEQTGLANFSSVVQIDNPIGWTLDYSPQGSTGPYGKFELANDGTGQYRQDPLIFHLYSNSFDLTVDHFAALNPSDYMFAAHIADFSGERVDSALFATTGAPVPEPGTFALLGAGLLGLFLYRKRTGN